MNSVILDDTDCGSNLLMLNRDQFFNRVELLLEGHSEEQHSAFRQTDKSMR